MRLVFTSDTHFPFKADRVPEGDVLFHSGDLMYSGYPDEWHSRVQSLRALPHRIKIYVPGNHDYHPQNYEGIARAELRRAGVTLLGTGPDPYYKLPNGMLVLGLPWVSNLNGWAFNRDETWIEDYLEALPLVPDIIISHAPPFNILDAVRPEALRARERENVGCLAYNRWFYKLSSTLPRKVPKYWSFGHIHESYGTTEIEGCTFINAAMCDRDYKQSNDAMVFDTED